MNNSIDKKLHSILDKFGDHVYSDGDPHYPTDESEAVDQIKALFEKRDKWFKLCNEMNDEIVKLKKDRKSLASKIEGMKQDESVIADIQTLSRIEGFNQALDSVLELIKYENQ